MKRIIPLVALGAVLFAVAAAPVQATAAPPSLPTPVAINENGQIVGSATTKTGQRHAVLWTLRSG